jgi:hypothetical protein
LEALTLVSFLLVFVRRKSKNEVRKSERYSTFVRNDPAFSPNGAREERAFVFDHEEPSTPRRAFAQLEGR